MERRFWSFGHRPWDVPSRPPCSLRSPELSCGRGEALGCALSFTAPGSDPLRSNPRAAPAHSHFQNGDLQACRSA